MKLRHLIDVFYRGGGGGAYSRSGRLGPLMKLASVTEV